MNQLRAQHGIAISPAPDELVGAVGARLSALAAEGPGGESFTTPDVSEVAIARRFAAGARLYDPTGARIDPSASWRECHFLTAALVATGRGRFAYVFGYARDELDAHWRTHSWALERETGRIVEMTPGLRTAYAGVEITLDEAVAAFGIDLAA